MKKISILTILVFSACCLFTSCKKGKEGDPPQLPGLSSMTIDFSYFNTSKSATKGTTYYFTKAAEIAATWTNLISQSLTTPIAAINSLAGQNASSGSFVEGNTWKWTFSAANSTIEAVGVVGASSVAWTVTIDDFAWVTGTSSTDGTSGTWNIQESASNATKILQIDWSTNGTIKYTSGNNNITFAPSATDATAYSSSLNGSHGTNTFSIEWKTSAGGRIKYPAEFSDNEWRAWNAEKANI